MGRSFVDAVLQKLPAGLKIHSTERDKARKQDTLFIKGLYKGPRNRWSNWESCGLHMTQRNRNFESLHTRRVPVFDRRGTHAKNTLPMLFRCLHCPVLHQKGRETNMSRSESYPYTVWLDHQGVYHRLWPISLISVQF